MEKFYPDYSGFQPPKSDFLQAPESVQKFTSMLVDKLKACADKLKSCRASLKLKDKLAFS